MDTKPIDKVYVSRKAYNGIIEMKRLELIKNKIDTLNQIIDEIILWLNEHFKQTDWIKFKDVDLYFNKVIDSIFPDSKTFSFGSCSTCYNFDTTSFHDKFSKYMGSLMTYREFCYIQGNKEYFEPFLEQDYAVFSVLVNNSDYGFVIVDSEAMVSSQGTYNRNFQYEAIHIPIFRLGSHDTIPVDCGIVLYQFLMNRLIPEGMSASLVEKYREILNLSQYCTTLFSPKTSKIKLENQQATQFLIAKWKESDLALKDETIIANLNDQEDVEMVSDTTLEEMKQALLECDKVRSDMDIYDERILSDPSRGHWDLWDGNMTKDGIPGKIKSALMARNPKSDIHWNGIIGIDFGTKSTVVVYQKDNNITYSMIIGKGSLTRKITQEYYENPTVMEFRDLNSFLKHYHEKAGRPNTRWADVTTSHTASESLLNSGCNQYYAHLNELKQWSGDSTRQIRLRDKKGADYILPPFLELDENGFNPIEVYAYYIGLYINNMRNGIFVDYLLSFPITYEKAIRDKIINSFRKGLIKSLPSSLLEDNTIIQKFRVREGVSEPVAYASCALQEYGFDPEGKDKIFYGVFDFGGGTTDFDFGLFMESDMRKYDYILECLGSGGDKYLGGENILELLAFEVFKENAVLMRENGYTFIQPPGCKDFNGSVVLVNKSQEARLNMKQLMEELRGYWEKTEGYETQYQSGQVKVSLFGKDMESKKQETLTINTKKLDEVIRERIEKGVSNFFERLKTAFNLPQNKQVDCVNIFLAGNSSKAKIVQQLFKEHIEQETKLLFGSASGQECKAVFSSKGEKYICKTEKFILFPPLGEQNKLSDKDEEKEDSIRIKTSEHIHKEEKEVENIRKITGKTGVAFGLIKCRPGGKIKILQNVKDHGQISFKYYIGFEKKGKFKMISDTQMEYNQWEYFDDAISEDIELYYSSKPEASTNQLSIEEVSRIKYSLKHCYEDGKIYYRAIQPSEIELVVASAEGITENSYLEDIVKFQLDE